MDVSSVMVQQMAQQVSSTTNMLKQSAKNNETAVGIVQQALDMAKDANSKTTETRGQNLNMLV